MESKINLTISAINVNSFNVSTAHQNNAKCYLKVEGITKKKADIILITDCRLNGERKKIEDLMALNLNCSYSKNFNISAVLFTFLFLNQLITGIFGVVLVILAGVFLLTSVVGTCPLYLPFKINTNHKK